MPGLVEQNEELTRGRSTRDDDGGQADQDGKQNRPGESPNERAAAERPHGDGGNLIGKFGKGPRPEIKPERPVTEQRHGADSKTRICNRARPYCETDGMCTMWAPGGDTPAR